MDFKLNSAAAVLERTDLRLRSPEQQVRVWPTGFPMLDDVIGGGLRAGSLNLLTAPQGQGKTFFALQVARAAAKSGRAVVFFSFELEAETLVQRLMAMETGETGDDNAPSLSDIRGIFEGKVGGAGGLVERLSAYPSALEALLCVNDYSDLLHVHRSTSTHTGLAEMTAAVKEVAAATGESPLVVVDYLQKVAMPLSELAEEERITKVTEGLKDLAIEFECPVFAIAAADHDGLAPGSRMRARHMRGSTALSYEPDVVLILSNKADVIARHHLVYGAGNAERFRDWSIVTVEKNRSGSDGVELEFRRRFDQGRFETAGNLVGETLIDERIYTE